MDARARRVCPVWELSLQNDARCDSGIRADAKAFLAANELPDHLLGRMLIYALHSDSDLDARGIYHTLSANPELGKSIMFVAEKLKAEGRVEGQEKGLWIGKIQAFEEFLDYPVSPNETLGAMGLEELEARHRDLHRDYETRFKRH